MKKTDHKNQLMLDFDNAVNKLNEAASDLGKAAQALASSGEKEREHVNITLEDQRKMINKLVKVHARHKKMHWKEVWRVLYDRLREKTGFDAVVRGISRGISPLDAVCKNGKLPKLIEIAEAF